MDQVRIVTGADGLTVATEGRSNGAGLRHHVSSKRPDLAQFLGLDYGYRFYSDNGEVLFHPAALE